MGREAVLQRSEPVPSRVVTFPGGDEQPSGLAATVTIRPAADADLPAIVALDQEATGTARPEYWAEALRHAAEGPRAGRHFLVAISEQRVIGFVVGDLRDWEFGTASCGWVIAIDVARAFREHGVGRRLMAEICGRFKAEGARTVRTLLARTDTLNFAFFRGNGLTAGPLVELERRL